MFIGLTSSLSYRPGPRFGARGILNLLPNLVGGTFKGNSLRLSVEPNAMDGLDAF